MLLERNKGYIRKKIYTQEPIADIYLKIKVTLFSIKLKKYEHFSETPMHYDYYHLQEIKKELFKYGRK